MKKIVFFGCANSSYLILKFLLKKKVRFEAIFTKRKSYNHDFKDLSKISKKNNIKYFYVKKTNSKNTIDKLKKIRPDYLICVGWPVLIKSKILKLVKKNSIGFHPSKLPYNKGRHPIIWSIVLGLKSTASSFFVINNDLNPDTGDLISQKKIIIKKEYDSGKLYSKIILTAKKQLFEIVKNIGQNNLKIIKKIKPNSGNYWRKRTKKDGEIDWRMSATSINNITRALTPPYPFAHFKYKKKEFLVEKSKEMKFKREYLNVEPGRVIMYHKQYPVIKCYKSFLKIYVKNKNFKPKIGESLI